MTFLHPDTGCIYTLTPDADAIPDAPDKKNTCRIRGKDKGILRKNVG